MCSKECYQPRGGGSVGIVRVGTFVWRVSTGGGLRVVAIIAFGHDGFSFYKYVIVRYHMCLQLSICSLGPNTSLVFRFVRVFFAKAGSSVFSVFLFRILLGRGIRPFYLFRYTTRLLGRFLILYSGALVQWYLSSFLWLVRFFLVQVRNGRVFQFQRCSPSSDFSRYRLKYGLSVGGLFYRVSLIIRVASVNHKRPRSLHV